MIKGTEQAVEDNGVIRTFNTGASRDTSLDKLDFEGFFSPLVMKRFAKYMHHNRQMADGSLRESDNWQKGIPKDVYMKSMFRHFMDVWSAHRGVGQASMEPSLCALMFNVMGYLHELLGQEVLSGHGMINFLDFLHEPLPVPPKVMRQGHVNWLLTPQRTPQSLCGGSDSDIECPDSPVEGDPYRARVLGDFPQPDVNQVVDPCKVNPICPKCGYVIHSRHHTCQGRKSARFMPHYGDSPEVAPAEEANPVPPTPNMAFAPGEDAPKGNGNSRQDRAKQVGRDFGICQDYYQFRKDPTVLALEHSLTRQRIGQILRAANPEKIKAWVRESTRMVANEHKVTKEARKLLAADYWKTYGDIDTKTPEFKKAARAVVKVLNAVSGH